MHHYDLADYSIDQFAPPNYSFAPPSNINVPPSVPAIDLLDDKTGDDAYTRRVKLSQSAQNAFAPPSYPPAPPQPSDITPPLAPPVEPLPPGVISRAPVRYNLPAAPSELPASEAELERALAEEPISDQEEPPPGDAEETSRSTRPGQKGFAERLMSKYGWSKGKGLGADETGIVSALHVKIEKRRKKPDSEGGGFADSKGIGKIIGGKRNMPAESEGGKFGPMSEVIVLKGMVDGMDLDDEVEGAGDGGLMQEIGDECAEKVRENTSFHLLKPRSILLIMDSTAVWREFSSTALVALQQQSSSNLRASSQVYGYVYSLIDIYHLI
jgi:splicing factor 45